MEIQHALIGPVPAADSLSRGAGVRRAEVRPWQARNSLWLLPGPSGVLEMKDMPIDSCRPKALIAQLYRERARHALSLARRARRHGNLDAALGLVDEALLWRSYAMDWRRRSAAQLV